MHKLIHFLFFTVTFSLNIIMDFAQKAHPNTTKIAFFYNMDANNESIPLDESNLNILSSYLTINDGLKRNNTFVKYYEAPYFNLNFSKNFNKSWLGAWPMNKAALNKWIEYSQEERMTPTFVWDVIKYKCFLSKSNIKLYDYSAIIPSVVPETFMYVFTWMDFTNGTNSTNNCVQSTYSLTNNKITCVAFQNIDCSPPFK